MPNIIILDDEASSRERLCAALSQRGDQYQVFPASSALRWTSLNEELRGAVDLLVMESSFVVAAPDTLEHFRSECPRAQILVLTHSSNARMPSLRIPFSDEVFANTVSGLLQPDDLELHNPLDLRHLHEHIEEENYLESHYSVRRSRPTA